MIDKCALAGVACASFLAAACAATAEPAPLSERDAALDALFPDYPAPGATYLSYDVAHGYQVIYYESATRAWLWYPGNEVTLPADVKIDDERVCWRYGANTYNPATRGEGGAFDCTSRVRSRRTKVGVREGDVYGLASGKPPYVRRKCDVPDGFDVIRDYATYQPAPDCVDSGVRTGTVDGPMVEDRIYDAERNGAPDAREEPDQ